MPIKRRDDFLSVVGGLVIALFAIFIIKKLLLPAVGGATPRDQIFSLEAAVILVLLAAFVLNEVMSVLTTLIKLRQGKSVHIELEPRAVGLLLMALSVSSLIYLYVANYLEK